MTAFIDKYRGRFGLELICRTLEVSASAYYRRKTGERSARSVEDERLNSRIRELHRENYECHPNPLAMRTGAVKVARNRGSWVERVCMVWRSGQEGPRFPRRWCRAPRPPA